MAIGSSCFSLAWVVLAAGLTALLAFGLLTASLLLLCFAVKDTKVQKLIEVGITDSKISLTFLRTYGNYNDFN